MPVSDFCVIAHRGLPRLYTENSLAGFAQLNATRLRTVEFDIRLSADGIPVVFHDLNLKRLTDHDATIHDLSFADLPPLHNGERIPSLAQVLEALPSDMAVHAEFKDAEAVIPADAIMRRFTGRIIGSSFLPEALIALHANHWPVLALFEGSDYREGLSRIQSYFQPAMIGLSAAQAMQPAADWLLELGIPLFAYTVNDYATAAHLRKRGWAGIYSDIAEQLQAELAR